MDGEIINQTVNSTIEEIRASPWKGRPAKTIFFGGGTPTFLEANLLVKLLEEVIKVHPPIEECEITSEANPGTVESEKCNQMFKAGFNRVSLGGQSFQPEDLVRLGRVHSTTQIGQAVTNFRNAGFRNLNIDLMFGLPGQSINAWRQNLDLVEKLHPEHLSLYCLTIEQNTRFYKLDQRGMLNLPTEDIQVQMYELARDFAQANGFDHYEISNFSKPGLQSQHNLAYWRSEEYYSYGPGAVGCYKDQAVWHRYTNLKHPKLYSETGSSTKSWRLETELLSSDERKLERIMMAIRLAEGVDVEWAQIEEASINQMVKRGWITRSEQRIKLTKEGQNFCSEVALALS